MLPFDGEIDREEAARNFAKPRYAKLAALCRTE